MRLPSAAGGQGNTESTQLSYFAAWPSLGGSWNFYKGPCVLLLARWIFFSTKRNVLGFFKNSRSVLFFLIFYLFIFGCVGSSFLWEGFL